MASGGDDQLPFFKVGNVARGFIAVGNVAYGFIAIGFSIAAGPVAIGLNAVSPVIAIGANAVAPISLSLINSIGVLAIAGVNGIGGFGWAGVNPGFQAVMGIVIGAVCLLGSLVLPRRKDGEDPMLAEVRAGQAALEDLTSGMVDQGWVEARLEQSEPGLIHLRQGDAIASMQVEGPQERARDGWFFVRAFDMQKVSEDAGYRSQPAHTRGLACTRSWFPERALPFWKRVSGLHQTNRVCLVVSGVASIAAGVVGFVWR